MSWLSKWERGKATISELPNNLKAFELTIQGYIELWNPYVWGVN